MWYKIKKVLIWQNNEEKQIYPKPFEYSYDFRNKNGTILNNDWWSQKNGTWVVESNWVSSATWRDCDVVKEIWTSLSNASKIKIQFTIQWSMDYSWKRYILFWLADASLSTQAGFILASGFDTTYVSVYMNGANNKWSDIGNIWTSTYSPIIEIDLVNKTMSWTVSWMWTSNLTLTDAMINTIKAMTHFKMYTTQHTFYLQDMSITVY